MNDNYPIVSSYNWGGVLSFSLLSLGALQRGYSEGVASNGNEPVPFASARRTKQLKGAVSFLIDKLQPGLLWGC